MASSSKYSKVEGFATAAGPDNEMLLCALLFLSAWNRGLEFQLCSNVEGAGAFDDVVFSFKTSGRWLTMYIQLKHKDKEDFNVKRCMLTTDSREKFFLRKYHNSYKKMKEAKKTETLLNGSFEHSTFVIFTNAEGNDDLGNPFSGDLSRMEEFVRQSSGSVYSFEADAQMLGCLGEEGAEFLSQFRLFCGQPNVKGLKLAVREELLKLERKTIRGLNFDRLCDCYLANVKAWFETKVTGDILNKNHNILLRSIHKVRLESCSEKTVHLYELELDFKLDRVPLPHAGLAIVESGDDYFQMSLTKLVQFNRGRCLVLTCQQLLENKPALLAARDERHLNCLIVCTQDWRSDLANECFEVINQLLCINDPWNVLFLQDENSRVGSELNRVFRGRCSKWLDAFDIWQLSDESTDKLIDKPINVGGYNTTLLESCIYEQMFYSMYFLNPSFVAALMVSDVPLDLSTYLSKDIRYVVKRKLQRVGKNASLLHDLRGTATIRVTKNNVLERSFLEMALDFVRVMKYSPSYSRENKMDVLNKLTQSRLDPDRDNGEVYVGPKFPLGLYECNCVGLRFGRDDAVTALRVCPSRDASEKASFLVVSNDTNEEDQRKLSEFYESKHLLSLRYGWLSHIWSPGDKFINPSFSGYISEMLCVVFRSTISALKSMLDKKTTAFAPRNSLASYNGMNRRVKLNFNQRRDQKKLT